ncbi:MAG: hypothetical protein QHH04_08490 [Methanolinea sp.]|nr:hypothetical protein [Methanolinea sp.]
MEIIKDKDLGQSPLDERVAALEKKVREIDALVKGLTEELLDLKSVAMKLSKVSEERARAEMRMTKPSPGGQGQGPIIMQAKTRPPAPVQRPAQSPAQTAPQSEPEKMDMIMQPDGTLKPEKRKNSDYIIASAGFSKKKQNVQGSGKKSDLIVAEDEEGEPAEKR